MSLGHRQEDAAVKFRHLGLTALLGLSVLSGWSLSAGEPARLGLPGATPIPSVQPGNAQALADGIAAHLRHGGTLKNYLVDIAVHGDTVRLTGEVLDQAQRDEVLRLVQGVPGVGRVVDRLTLIQPAVKLAQGQDNKGPEDKGPEVLPPPEPNNNNRPAPPGPGNGNGGRSMPEPTPIFSAPMPAYTAQHPPAMPPYAWSTYAPYNNFSRVAYPLAYPYKSWPFIGPVYPFPKVPLGWRAVKLEWDDGYWWYSRVGCKYDWWKIRYW
jgi:hypothetical protein